MAKKRYYQGLKDRMDESKAMKKKDRMGKSQGAMLPEDRKTMYVDNYGPDMMGYDDSVEAYDMQERDDRMKVERSNPKSRF